MCCKAAPRYCMPCTFSTHVWNLHLNKNQPQSKTVCIANEPELNTGNDLYKKPTPTKPTCHLMAITTLGPAVLPAKPGRLQVERHQPLSLTTTSSTRRRQPGNPDQQLHCYLIRQVMLREHPTNTASANNPVLKELFSIDSIPKAPAAMPSYAVTSLLTSSPLLDDKSTQFEKMSTIIVFSSSCICIWKFK